jgi:hypothetical protein
MKTKPEARHVYNPSTLWKYTDSCRRTEHKPDIISNSMSTNFDKDQPQLTLKIPETSSTSTSAEGAQSIKTPTQPAQSSKRSSMNLSAVTPTGQPLSAIDDPKSFFSQAIDSNIKWEPSKSPQRSNTQESDPGDNLIIYPPL